MNWIELFSFFMILFMVAGIAVNAASRAPLDEFGRRIEHDD
ncbi:hypothetical protein [Neisseria sicca]|nr:hypothetical protein [Neisseria sicca]